MYGCLLRDLVFAGEQFCGERGDLVPAVAVQHGQQSIVDVRARRGASGAVEPLLGAGQVARRDVAERLLPQPRRPAGAVDDEVHAAGNTGSLDRVLAAERRVAQACEGLI